jgi:hypothetical protein
MGIQLSPFNEEKENVKRRNAISYYKTKLFYTKNKKTQLLHAMSRCTKMPLQSFAKDGE